MEGLTYTAASVHKQRMHDLMEEAKIERFLNERKHREANLWLQRRLQRQRKAEQIS